jgi:hypothetical protein
VSASLALPPDSVANSSDRQGGGSTFGVITSVTIKTFPTMPVASLTLSMYSEADSVAYWGANAYLLSQSSHLIQSGVYGYVFTGGSVVGFVPNTSTPASVYTGSFLAPRSTSAAVTELFAPIIEYISTTWPGQLIISVNTADFPDYYSWWIAHTSAVGVGRDLCDWVPVAGWRRIGLSTDRVGADARRNNTAGWPHKCQPHYRVGRMVRGAQRGKRQCASGVEKCVRGIRYETFLYETFFPPVSPLLLGHMLTD